MLTRIAYSQIAVSLREKNGLAPSERSVTRFLTVTSRPLTLAFNLHSFTPISHCDLSAYIRLDKPFRKCLFLNSYPLLLSSHLHGFIDFVTGTVQGGKMIIVKTVAIINALLYLWSIEARG